jgi:ribonuclease VapC
VDIVLIREREALLALEAFDRFGKGRHPAGLNMGDCFAYACAHALGVPLLFKGDDFARTDLGSG